MNTFKNFKRIVATREQKHFTFFPDELITTPQEFAVALMAYAREQGKELDITKLSMSPNFMLDGIEYNATRMTSLFGSFVVANALHPELLDDPGIPQKSRKVLEATWRYVVPICFWLGLLLLLLLPMLLQYTAMYTYH